MIDRQQIYKVKEYCYKNFCILSDREVELVWLWRNDEKIRQWMANSELIPLKTHRQFIESLVDRDNMYYWLVYKDESPVGVVSAINVDYSKGTAEVGYYLAPKLMDSGEGFRLHYSYKFFFFDILGFEKLTGYIRSGNTRAFQLTMFMGGCVVGSFMKNGIRYLDVIVPREKFQQLRDEKLLKQFIRYIKENHVDWDKLLGDI